MGILSAAGYESVLCPEWAAQTAGLLSACRLESCRAMRLSGVPAVPEICEPAAICKEPSLRQVYELLRAAGEPLPQWEAWLRMFLTGCATAQPHMGIAGGGRLFCLRNGCCPHATRGVARRRGGFAGKAWREAWLLSGRRPLQCAFTGGQGRLFIPPGGHAQAVL